MRSVDEDVVSTDVSARDVMAITGMRFLPNANLTNATSSFVAPNFQISIKLLPCNTSRLVALYQFSKSHCHILHAAYLRMLDRISFVDKSNYHCPRFCTGRWSMKLHVSGAIAGASLAVLFGLGNGARADAIPYPAVGTPNTAAYTFTAPADGDIIAYFAGSTAGFDLRLGLLVNGTLTNAGLALDNHTSAIGQSFNFGSVKAGDTLTFVLHNLTLGLNAFSDPSLNVGYDLNGTVGHQHIYSTAYTRTSPIIDSIPAGTYVAFEDQQFPNSNFNYFDETFVITEAIPLNTQVQVPGPIVGAGLPGLILASGGLLGWWRRRHQS
jgi:hypothetical protein